MFSFQDVLYFVESQLLLFFHSSAAVLIRNSAWVERDESWSFFSLLMYFIADMWKRPETHFEVFKQWKITGAQEKVSFDRCSSAAIFFSWCVR